MQPYLIPNPPTYPKGKPWSSAPEVRAGDSLCFDEARDGTLILLKCRDGRIIQADATSWNDGA